MGFKRALTRNIFKIKISGFQSIVFQNSFEQERKRQFCQKAIVQLQAS